MNLPARVPGGQSRLLATVVLHNQRPVLPGVHHDVEHPIAVTVVLHWETGTEQLDTYAVEWWGHVIRVRITDQRVMAGVIWLPVEDVRRR